MTKLVQIIISSVRTSRVGDQVAAYVKNVMQASSPYRFEIVDLKDYQLPLLSDEPNIPAYKNYTQKHTIAWSEKISQADSYVFVTPEYNGSIPASLKNAIDYLYQEWAGKPTVVVSYANKGGSFAAEHLKFITSRMGMKPVNTTPAILTTPDRRDEQNRILNPEVAFESHRESIEKATQELVNSFSQ
ncbi:hypothetical protein CYY_008768 [Polysphondylium violaceum]|uniref:NADPH-dependent FMN reductase-like domain-containing protein n=1 Tax=Polysphondylium violaceum TaxID=133409 RepID=A0A8J4UPY9_9MYCE|nr:hypothetical protein CYY_008768 [Polysphondylium violaceum]